MLDRMFIYKYDWQDNQRSVLGHLNFCIFMYPLGLILRHHGINYHSYAIYFF